MAHAPRELGAITTTTPVAVTTDTCTLGGWSFQAGASGATVVIDNGQGVQLAVVTLGNNVTHTPTGLNVVAQGGIVLTVTAGALASGTIYRS